MAIPLEYWTTGSYFLNLVEVACGELVQRENAYFVVSSNLDEATRMVNFREQTKWSDVSIGVPLLFNFFHGIELVLKGFNLVKGDKANHHRLTELAAVFEKNYPCSEIGKIINAYIGKLEETSPLGQFFKANGLSADDWYEAFKYPESRKGKSFTHIDLKYGSTRTVEFWKTLGESAVKLKVEAIKLSRSLNHE